MREVNSMWFGGNGKDSTQKMDRLLDRVQQAFITMSGTQQAPHSGESEENCTRHEQLCAESEIEVEDVARDIFCALTGREVVRTN